MKRKLLKLLVWTATIVIGLPLLLYIILVAVNWNDREPSSLAIKLMDEYRANSIVTKKDNGYVDVMGFAVAPDDDPHAMGLKRVEWVSKANQFGRTNAGADPQDKPYDFKSKRDTKVQAVSNAC
ncbi:MAG: hypothetical protein ABUL58_07445, partial [Steroidobacter sp.]